MRIVYLSAAIVPAGSFDLLFIPNPFDLARLHTAIAAGAEEVSYVGHPATAKFLSGKTGRPVEMNRGNWVPQAGDLVVCSTVKPGMRLDPQAEILSQEELESFMVVEFRFVYATSEFMAAISDAARLF